MHTAIICSRVGPSAWDIRLPQKKFDAHLSWHADLKLWMLDMFDSRIRDANKAYVDTEEIEGSAKNVDWSDVCVSLLSTLKTLRK